MAKFQRLHPDGWSFGFSSGLFELILEPQMLEPTLEEIRRYISKRSEALWELHDEPEAVERAARIYRILKKTSRFKGFHEDLQILFEALSFMKNMKKGPLKFKSDRDAFERAYDMAISMDSIHGE